MISMLGDEKGTAPGGFLLDATSSSTRPLGSETGGMKFNYDFWYQPRHNVMVSSEWARPTRTRPASSSTT